MLSCNTTVFVEFAALTLSTTRGKHWCKQHGYEASVSSYKRLACLLSSFGPQALRLDTTVMRAEYK